MVLLPRDLTQNEAANAAIYGELVQSEIANAASYRDQILCKLRVTMLESTCFCNDPFPKRPHK